MRTLSSGGALAVLVIMLAACGGASPASSGDLAIQRDADLYQITEIERKWHQATTTHDIDLMMSLWAEDATFTVASGDTLTGKDAIRTFWHARSRVPARHPLGLGDACLQAPRHGERRQGDAVLRVPLRRPGDERGRRASWGPTSRSRGSTGSGSSRTTWEPPRSWPLDPVHEPQAPGQPPTSAAKRRLSPADNPLVRAIGRLPAKVHTKLLVAFLATALLVVVVGLLGLRVLGQSNERVETIRELHDRALAYGQLQSDVQHVRLLLAENVGEDFDDVNNPGPPASGQEVLAVDLAAASAVARIEPATAANRLGFVPPATDAELLEDIRLKSTRLETVMDQIVASDEAGIRQRSAGHSVTRPSSSPSTSTSSPASSPTSRRRRPTRSSPRTPTPTRPRATCSSWSRPGRSCSP